MLLRRKPVRMKNEINAGSMADIAFLLLIFFLVSTQISSDKAVIVELAPYSVGAATEVIITPNNLVKINIVGSDTLQFNDESLEVSKLRTMVKDFVKNPSKSPNFATKPQDVMISLSKSGSTTYARYLQVYTETLAAYREMWDEIAQQKHSLYFSQLDESQKKEITALIPFTYSENDAIK
jgi:biopolymer transport protein ExbD